MMNRLTKKIAYVLCISSLVSLTTVESVQHNNRDNNNESTAMVVAASNASNATVAATSNASNENTVKNFEIENGLIGLNRDINVALMRELFRRQLCNMVNVSQEMMNFTRHKNYVFHRRQDDKRFAKLCNAFTKWENVPLENGIITEDSHIACNGQTIVIAGRNGIFCSNDGEIYRRTCDYPISNIIVADGKYMAYSGNALLISNDGVNWQVCRCDHISRISYDKDNKIYRCASIYSLYSSQNIAELTKYNKNNCIPYPNKYWYPEVCSGNGMTVMAYNGENYYLTNNGVLKKTLLNGDIICMHYNEINKSIMAIVEKNPYSSEDRGFRNFDSPWNHFNRDDSSYPLNTYTSWTVYSTKSGRAWEREFNTEKSFDFCIGYHWSDRYLNTDYKPIIATIDAYSVVIIQSRTRCLYVRGDQSTVDILVKKDNAPWERIQKISGIDKDCKIKQLIETNNGIFMLTNNSLKKAVGRMPQFQRNKKNPASCFE